MKKPLNVLLPLLIILPLVASAQVVDTMWTRSFDGGEDNYDLLGDMVVDTAGTVYATGSKYSFAEGDNFLTVACDKWGRKLWSASFDGGDGDNDSAAAIAIDRQRNLYVIGTAIEDDTSTIVTVKYRADSTVLWVSRLHFPGDLADGAVDIAVSESGAVYACGWRFVDTLLSNYDYVTIRYNPETGDTIWTRSWDNPDAHSEDVTTALATDHAGNVAVTGYSYTDWTWYDYATIKYDSLGNEVWLRYYNREGGSGNQEDMPWAIACDRQNAVIVTGQLYDDNTSCDYLTVKYGSAGDTAWTRRYNRAPANDDDIAVAIALDNLDNVCVTGSSYDSTGDADYATIRYNPTGTQRWVARYNGSMDEDMANSVAIGPGDSVCVTGWSFDAGGGEYMATTVLYDPQIGTTIWTSSYAGPGMNDAWGQKVVVSSSQQIYVGVQTTDTVQDVNFGIIRMYEPTHDCGVRAILVPADTIFLGDTLVPQVVVRNYGVLTDTLLTRLTIGATYVDTLSKFMQIRTNETLSFRPWIPASVGVYQVRCTTLLATDVNPFNDPGRDSFSVFLGDTSGISEQLVVIKPFLQVAPNPAYGQAWIRYAVPDPENLKLRVYDAVGREVLRLDAADRRRINTINLNVRDMANGIYIVKLETQRFESTNKLVIQR